MSQRPATIPGWVEKYIGVPWREGGRSPDGCDCWGLYVLVLEREFGIRVPRYDSIYWSKQSPLKALRAIREGEMSGQWEVVPDGMERPGDGILLLIDRQPIHVGVIVVPGRMLHIEEGVDAYLDEYRSMKWEHRRRGIYRFKGGAA